MNDTVGLEGIVPFLLVLGAIPRFPPHSSPLLIQQDRMRALQTARLEMVDITAKLRIQRALKAKLRPASKEIISLGDKLYVNHEMDKVWKGLCSITSTFEKMVWAQRPEKEAKCSIDHTLPVPQAADSTLINQLSDAFQQCTTQSTTCHI